MPEQVKLTEPQGPEVEQLGEGDVEVDSSQSDVSVATVVEGADSTPLADVQAPDHSPDIEEDAGRPEPAEQRTLAPEVLDLCVVDFKSQIEYAARERAEERLHDMLSDNNFFRRTIGSMFEAYHKVSFIKSATKEIVSELQTKSCFSELPIEDQQALVTRFVDRDNLITKSESKTLIADSELEQQLKELLQRYASGQIADKEGFELEKEKVLRGLGSKHGNAIGDLKTSCDNIFEYAVALKAQAEAGHVIDLSNTKINLTVGRSVHASNEEVRYDLVDRAVKFTERVGLSAIINPSAIGIAYTLFSGQFLSPVRSHVGAIVGGLLGASLVGGAVGALRKKDKIKDDIRTTRSRKTFNSRQVSGRFKGKGDILASLVGAPALNSLVHNQKRASQLTHNIQQKVLALSATSGAAPESSTFQEAIEAIAEADARREYGEVRGVDFISYDSQDSVERSRIQLYKTLAIAKRVIEEHLTSNPEGFAVEDYKKALLERTAHHKTVLMNEASAVDSAASKFRNVEMANAFIYGAVTAAAFGVSTRFVGGMANGFVHLDPVENWLANNPVGSKIADFLHIRATETSSVPTAMSAHSSASVAAVEPVSPGHSHNLETVHIKRPFWWDNDTAAVHEGNELRLQISEGQKYEFDIVGMKDHPSFHAGKLVDVAKLLHEGKVGMYVTSHDGQSIVLMPDANGTFHVDPNSEIGHVIIHNGKFDFKFAEAAEIVKSENGTHWIKPLATAVREQVSGVAPSVPHAPAVVPILPSLNDSEIVRIKDLPMPSLWLPLSKRKALLFGAGEGSVQVAEERDGDDLGRINSEEPLEAHEENGAENDQPADPASSNDVDQNGVATEAAASAEKMKSEFEIRRSIYRYDNFLPEGFFGMPEEQRLAAAQEAIVRGHKYYEHDPSEYLAQDAAQLAQLNVGSSSENALPEGALLGPAIDPVDVENEAQRSEALVLGDKPAVATGAIDRNWGRRPLRRVRVIRSNGGVSFR